MARCNDSRVRSRNLKVNNRDKSADRPLLTRPDGCAPDFGSAGFAGADMAGRRYPAVTFSAVSKRTYSDITPLRRLTGDADYLHWSGAVADIDIKSVCADLKSVYKSITDRAHIQGYYCQPVMLWYKVLDASGRELFRSAPVVVGLGWQGLSEMSAGIDHETTGEPIRKRFTMSVDGFRIGMTVPDCSDGDYDDAASLEVMLTHPLTPMSESFNSVVSMGRDSEGRQVLNARVVKSQYAGSLVGALLDRLDDVSRTAIRFRRPFSGGIKGAPGESVVISPARYLSAEDEYKALIKSLGTAVAPRDSLIGESTLPHGFSADVAAVFGDMVVYGGIRPVHAKPPRLSDIMSASGSGEAWTALLRLTVQGADGGEEVLVTSESRGSGMPESFSPLMAYPHPGAVRLQIQLTGAGGAVRKSLDFKLNPTPCGRMSYWQSDDLVPVSVGSGAEGAVGLLPADRPASYTRAGTMAVASADDPARLKSVLTVCEGAIVAVTPSARSSSAWDFGRRHLYVFSTSGVYSVAVNASCSLASSHLIGGLPVKSGRHVAYSPAGVYFLSEGALWRAVGSRVEQVMADVGADVLVWDNPGEEVWCRRDDGSCVVLGDRGLWYESLPDRPDYAEWGMRVDVEGTTPRALRRMSWLMSGSEVSLDISVRGDNGSPASAVEVAAYHVEGTVGAALRFAVAARPFRYLDVSVSGTVGDDFRLDGLMLGFDR